MFKNIGKTLYVVGLILFWLFLVCGLFGLLAFLSPSESSAGLYLGMALPVSAFLFALPICGFGRLIQDVQAIRENTAKGN